MAITEKTVTFAVREAFEAPMFRIKACDEHPTNTYKKRHEKLSRTLLYFLSTLLEPVDVSHIRAQRFRVADEELSRFVHVIEL